MRYTRYDLKGNGKGNFVIWLVVIMLLGTLLGIGIYKILISSNFFGINSEDNNSIIDKKQSDYNIYVIQCGVYKNRENADMQLKSLEDDSRPFIVQEEDKFKVMSGIYESGNLDENVKKAESKNITNFVIKYEMKGNSNEEIIKMNIIQGYIQIMNEFQKDSDVKAIDTDKFKEWAQSIFNEYNSSDEEIETIKDKINNLPKEYTKENIKEDSVFYYNMLNKYRVN